MKIASVIVTFNRLEKLKLTVEKTLKEDVDLCIVVNNASTDGTKSWLDCLNDERLRIINLNENIGGAGGFNRGFYEAAHKSDVDWIVCYDDDAYPYNGAISTFKALSLNAMVGSVASAVYLPNGEIAEMNRPSQNPFWHIPRFFKTIFAGRQGFHVRDEEYKSVKSIDIDASSFVGYFVRTSVVRSIGLPRQELFIYADDIIYALTVRKAGYKHSFIPTICFMHDCGTLINQKAIYSPLWRAYYTYRNGFEMYRYTAGIFFYPIVVLKIFLWYRKSKFYTNPNLYKKIMWLAIKDGLLKNFDRSHMEVVKISITEKQLIK